MSRLDEIIKLVDENKIVADIGSDHGITAIKIYEIKNPKKVIATDISKNSLKKLNDKLKVLNYPIKTIITDGIKDIPDKLEQIIISGMGGILISNIIEKGIQKAKEAEKLILQANNSLNFLRKFLHKNEFRITNEIMVEDEDIIYTIIECKKGKDIEYTDIDYEYGKINIDRKDENLRKLLKRELNHLDLIDEKINQINTESSNQRMEEINFKRKFLENLLCRL